jgi:predicted nucleotidyltransferase
VNLLQEAVKITDELGKVVFIGALAVNHYARFRGTLDIDLVLTIPIDEDKLGGLGYRKREGGRNSWYTPRGIRADFYTKDVAGMPPEWIVRTATTAKVGRRTISVISLEGLILAKHRAARSQDIADLRRLMALRGHDIKWDVIGEIGSDLEVTELKRIARAFGS